jgi:uncharacterized protein (TIGR02453 family)
VSTYHQELPGAAQHSGIDAAWESCNLIPHFRNDSAMMASSEPIFTRDTFRFFRDLARHNKKTWMDANRARYQECVVQPFRRLLDETAQSVLALDSRFDTAARGGKNFSRINRDTRFAKDKTPYRAQMYLKFSVPFPGDAETGELYVGMTADAVTAGFRIYAGSKYKDSALARVAAPKIARDPACLSRQKKRLGRRCESYWYSAEKSQWTKQPGWPTARDWSRLRGWIVRRNLTPAAATRASFSRDVAKIFRDVYPLICLTSLGE